MSVYLYDDVIVDFFRKKLNDSKITIGTTENLFPYRADTAQYKEEIKLPLVSLTRIDFDLLSTTKTPSSYDGYTGINQTHIDGVDSVTIPKLRKIPIKINYQLDIVTRNRIDNDNLTRELIFLLVNNPTLIVSIPYKNCPYTHKFNLRLEENVPDNSDIPQHINIGESFRQTISMYVDDAYLFNYTTKDSLQADVNVETLNFEGDNK